MTALRSTSQYSIPCPCHLKDLRDLLPHRTPIRLSAIKGDVKLGADYIYPPTHYFGDDVKLYDALTRDFWVNTYPRITDSTECILRKHGKQTVIQFNL